MFIQTLLAFADCLFPSFPNVSNVTLTNIMGIMKLESGNTLGNNLIGNNNSATEINAHTFVNHYYPNDKSW